MNLLIYIFLVIQLLDVYSIKIITNKIIDIKNINIHRYSVYSSILFVPFDKFIKQKKKYNKFIRQKNIYNNCATNNNNIIYVYRIEKQSNVERPSSPSIIDFLMVMHLYNMEISIITSINKYFKPYQYTIYDILLYQYSDNKLIFKDKIKKYKKHYIINNNSENIIRV